MKIFNTATSTGTNFSYIHLLCSLLTCCLYTAVSMISWRNIYKFAIFFKKDWRYSLSLRKYRLYNPFWSQFTVRCISIASIFWGEWGIWIVTEGQICRYSSSRFPLVKKQTIILFNNSVFSNFRDNSKNRTSSDVLNSANQRLEMGTLLILLLQEPTTIESSLIFD